MHLKNLSNSPYELFNAEGGKVMIPARGEIDIEPHPMYAHYYRQCGYFIVSESEGVIDDDDSTGDDATAGTVDDDATVAPDVVTAPEPVDEREALRAEYEHLAGSAPDKRWSEKRLRDAIEIMKGDDDG